MSSISSHARRVWSQLLDAAGLAVVLGFSLGGLAWFLSRPPRTDGVALYLLRGLCAGLLGTVYFLFEGATDIADAAAEDPDEATPSTFSFRVRPRALLGFAAVTIVGFVILGVIWGVLKHAV